MEGMSCGHSIVMKNRIARIQTFCRMGVTKELQEDMTEKICSFWNYEKKDRPFNVLLAGVSYCDGTYRIERKPENLYSFEYICLFIILPQVLILSLFSAFRRFLVVYLVPLRVAVCV